MKHLNVPLDDSEYENLKDAKGNRTWKEALIEEMLHSPDTDGVSKIDVSSELDNERIKELEKMAADRAPAQLIVSEIPTSDMGDFDTVECTSEFDTAEQRLEWTMNELDVTPNEDLRELIEEWRGSTYRVWEAAEAAGDCSDELEELVENE